MTKIEFQRTETNWKNAMRGTQARKAMRCTGELLLELGIAPHRNGYDALLHGTVLLMTQEQRRVPLGKVLYPSAEPQAGNAEHAIRDTVRTGWQQKPSALRGALFPEARIPTNADLIYTLAACALERLRTGGSE